MIGRTYSVRVLLVMIVGLFSSVPLARADEAYYMMIFGQQDRGNSVPASHTYATFTKATGEGSDKSDYKLETHTISWMPKSMRVRTFAPPEQGVNLDAKESVDFGRSIGASVTIYGPFEIKKELYERAVKQEERLKKGEVAYTVMDRRYRPVGAMNCIHALCDIDADNGMLETGTNRGNQASLTVLSHFSRWLVDRDTTHDWLIKRLELGDSIVQQKVQFRSDDGIVCW